MHCANCADDAIFSSRTTAEELVAALQLRRYSKVNSSNFRIKGCPQLNRSDVSIFFQAALNVMCHHQIQFGLQTRVEMLEGLDHQVLSNSDPAASLLQSC